LVPNIVRGAIERLLTAGQQGAALVALAQYGRYLLDRYGTDAIAAIFGAHGVPFDDCVRTGSVSTAGYSLRDGGSEDAALYIARRRAEGFESEALYLLAMNGREILRDHGTTPIYRLFNVEPPTLRSTDEIEELDESEYDLIEDERPQLGETPESEEVLSQEEIDEIMAFAETAGKEDSDV
jgi:hypothetical protein